LPWKNLAGHPALSVCAEQLLTIRAQFASCDLRRRYTDALWGHEHRIRRLALADNPEHGRKDEMALLQFLLEQTECAFSDRRG
jgi:hypothetical protein